MATRKVARLSREEILKTARNFQWNHQLPKWTVEVEGRELPARPLVLEAAGVAPNDPTNSHQAVALLKDRGFNIRYQGNALTGAERDRYASSVTMEYIHGLRGCCKGEDSLVEAREQDHRIEKN